MAQIDVNNPKRLRTPYEPNKFEFNHINRIRRANSLSSCASYSSSNESNTDTNYATQNERRLRDLNDSQKTYPNYLPGEEFVKNKKNDLNSDDPQSNEKQNMKNTANLKILNRRRSSEASHINRIREANAKRWQTIFGNTEFLKKKNETSLKDESNQAFEDKNSLKSPLSSKTNTISKWLRSIRSPDYEIKRDNENSPKIKRSSVQILKIPIDTNTNNQMDNQKSSSDKKKPTTTNKKRNVNSKKYKQSTNSPSQLENRAMDSPKLNARELSGVEMDVTELGKLRIAFDPNSLSPEDSVILIFIDDIPKPFFLPDYRRRLGLSSRSVVEIERVSTDVMKSKSESHLKDITPNPYAYFPSVTVLKNITVDSEAELEQLSSFSSEIEDFSESKHSV